ncbi:MAG: hypothetical protein JWP97_3310 [Labilithrix sp.]|nr:hypothetical protein [Labilithrix sp.]
MRREIGVLAAVATLLSGHLALAQQPRAAGPVDPSAPLPAGHPAMPGPAEAQGDEDDGDAPNAHGSGADGPHAGVSTGGGSAGGTADAPEDLVTDDPTAPAGSIVMQAVDPTGRPLGRTEVTLGILYNSVAKGESKKRITQMTDDGGVARFSKLDTGSGVAYRPMILKDGGTFAATPFALGATGGKRVQVHVYPVTSDVEQTMIVSQAMLYAELKDDRIQIQQALRIYNFGKNAWVPKDALVALPEGWTAFATQQGMTDVAAEAVDKKGVSLHGTFTPGQHVVEFRWQLPYSGEAEIKFDVGMPPHLAAARVIAPSSRNMTMDVEGFDKPRPTSDGQGQRALVTEKQVRREDPPVKSVKVTIGGLPTEGPGKLVASLLAFSGLVAGLVLGSRRAQARDTKREREQLLAQLEALELAHRDGSVGPKTYERGRRELLDEIARTFAEDAPATVAKPAKSKRKAA